MTCKFDDRQTDFMTGRKISPPMDERKTCNCCGQRIVKGWKLDNGDHVGDDCYDIIGRATRYQGIDFAVMYKRQTGWTLKPAVMRYLERQDKKRRVLDAWDRMEHADRRDFLDRKSEVEREMRRSL